MKTNRFNQPNFRFSSGLGRFIQDAFEGLDDIGELLSQSAVAKPVPQTDLFEDDHHIFVTVELPGVRKEDVKVELLEGNLEIAATLSRETSDGRKNIPLNRTLSLPDQVGAGDLRAKLEDGILTVTLPKSEEAKPRTITIE